jgi:proline iminopeptidase
MSISSPWTRRSVLESGAALLACTATGAMARPAIAETDGFCPVPGGKVYWRRFGSANGTPLLVLHGGPGAAHNYMLSLRALADERPVIFYDQLGCGKADAPTEEALYTIKRSVDELDAVRHALDLPEVILVGHSWGAFLAIEYMCQGRGRGLSLSPHRVTRVDGKFARTRRDQLPKIRASHSWLFRAALRSMAERPHPTQ